jgi:hypothetical protein
LPRLSDILNKILNVRLFFVLTLQVNRSPGLFCSSHSSISEAVSMVLNYTPVVVCPSPEAVCSADAECLVPILGIWLRTSADEVGELVIPKVEIPRYFCFPQKFLFISFAPPKEMNQRKGGRKRQPQPVCPLATQGLYAPPNRLRFAPFPVSPRTSILII